MGSAAAGVVVERERAAAENRTRDAGAAGVKSGVEGVQGGVHETPDRGGDEAVLPGGVLAEAGKVRGEEAGAAVVADPVHEVDQQGPLEEMAAILARRVCTRTNTKGAPRVCGVPFSISSFR
ncbi:hypothetical protein ACWGIU_03110 [Streptomyces sp. NPDC054840]